MLAFLIDGVYLQNNRTKHIEPEADPGIARVWHFYTLVPYTLMILYVAPSLTNN